MLPRPIRSWRPRRVALVVALVVVLGGAGVALLPPGGDGRTFSDLGLAPRDAVGGGSSAGEWDGMDESLADTSPGAPAPTGEASSGAYGVDRLGGLALPVAAPSTARVVKEAALSLEVSGSRLDPTHRRALELVGEVGGFVQSSQVADGRVGLVLRVPAGELERLVARLGALGRVVEESTSGTDVTAEFVDLEARLRHWRAQEAAFLGLMSRATTLSETIEVQRQLSGVQEQIEQLEGRRRLLEDHTQLSTVRLSLAEPGLAVSPDEPPALVRSWQRAGEAALAVVGGMLVVAGALGPLAVLALILVLLARPLLRRRPAPATESGGAGGVGGGA